MQQRLVGGAVAVIVLVASVIGVSPVHTAIGGTGNVLGAGTGPRLAIGGGTSQGRDGFGGPIGSESGGTDGGFGGLTDPAQTSADTSVLSGFAAAAGPATDQQGADQADFVDPLIGGGSTIDSTVATQDAAGPTSPVIQGFTGTPDSGPAGPIPASATAPTLTANAQNLGAFLADGTILKPIAVDTTIPDARNLLTHYKVRRGDTLTSIAHHFDLSLVTLYWANHLIANLRTKTDLRVGQTLSIPPVNGVLHIVTDTETLSDISKRTGISLNRIVAANGLKQPTVFVGQWIIIPGAKSKPIPVPAPRPKPVAKPVARSSTSTPAAGPAPKPVIRPTYTGGGWAWPVPGGFISQYFHYGHWAIDIADTWGAPVLAAKAGVVIFAGWKNNGGGWQVWMSHGNGIYTTYNHMSSLTVGAGEVIAAGRQVGRIGMTGDATGPHCHFEVWIGPIWAGGTRVNPLNYV